MQSKVLGLSLMTLACLIPAACEVAPVGGATAGSGQRQSLSRTSRLCEKCEELNGTYSFVKVCEPVQGWENWGWMTLNYRCGDLQATALDEWCANAVHWGFTKQQNAAAVRMCVQSGTSPLGPNVISESGYPCKFDDFPMNQAFLEQEPAC